MTPQEAYYKSLKEETRIPELEEVINKDSMYSYSYCLNVIRGPWESGENIISKDPKNSYFYARDIIKGVWERGEEAISKDPQWSYHYAHDIIKGPFEKSHPIIFNSGWKNDYIRFLKSINYDYSEWLI